MLLRVLRAVFVEDWPDPEVSRLTTRILLVYAPILVGLVVCLSLYKQNFTVGLIALIVPACFGFLAAIKTAHWRS